jgi:hypothetical protein
LQFVLTLICVCTAIFISPQTAHAEAVSMPAGSSETQPAFTDTAGHWGSDAIETWAERGVIKGDGTLFRPDDTLTRAELAVILTNLMGYQTEAENTFHDIKTGDWYADAVLKANAAGILYGDSTGNALPSANVTREQAAVMLGRAFGVDDASAGTSTFQDAAAVSSWAAGKVFGMEADKYISGMGNGDFEPQAYVTRAQIVSMIDKAVRAYYDTAGTYTEDAAAAGDGANGLAIVRSGGVVLKDLSLKGDLIIAEGVANGDFTLDGTNVAGKVSIRGGGKDSIHIINGASVNGKIYIEKIDGVVRIVTKDAVIAQLDAEADTEVILEGSFSDVALEEGTTVRILGTVGTVTMTGKADLSVEKGAAVGTLTLKDTAEGSSVNLEGTVKTVVNETSTTKVASAKTEETVVSGGGGGGGGGGSSGGGTSDTITAVSAAALANAKAVAAALTSTDYTGTSWSVLTTALAMAESTNTEVTAKTAAINAAIAALVTDYSVSELGGSLTVVATGVYDITFSKAVILAKFSGATTAKKLTISIPDSEYGTYTAVYVDSLSAWLVYDIQNASSADIQSGTVTIAD